MPTNPNKCMDNDPRYVDPIKLKRAEWLTNLWRKINPTGKPMHVRGLYYATVSLGNVIMPLGQKPWKMKFTNCDECWVKFQHATVNARWLKMVPWGAVIDERSDEPEIVEILREEWAPRLHKMVLVPRVELHERLVQE